MREVCNTEFANLHSLSFSAINFIHDNFNVAALNCSLLIYLKAILQLQKLTVSCYFPISTMKDFTPLLNVLIAL